LRYSQADLSQKRCLKTEYVFFHSILILAESQWQAISSRLCTAIYMNMQFILCSQNSWESHQSALPAERMAFRPDNLFQGRLSTANSFKFDDFNPAGIARYTPSAVPLIPSVRSAGHPEHTSAARTGTSGLGFS